MACAAISRQAMCGNVASKRGEARRAIYTGQKWPVSNEKACDESG